MQNGGGFVAFPACKARIFSLILFVCLFVFFLSGGGQKQKAERKMLRALTRRSLVRVTLPLLKLESQLPTAFSFLDEHVEDPTLGGAYHHSDDLIVTLTRQDEYILRMHACRALTLETETGVIGVLHGHSYKIAKLVPGVIQIHTKDGKSEKYFTSGGFAHINPNGSCDLTTVECIPLEELDATMAEREMQRANQNKVSGSAMQKQVGEIQASVCEKVIAALRMAGQA